MRCGVKSSTSALETSFRGQTRVSVCMGSHLSHRNMTKAGIGFTQATAEMSSPLSGLYRSLIIILHSTRVDYVLCGNGFYTLSNIERNKSKCCPALPGALDECRRMLAGTHAELLKHYQVSRITTSGVSSTNLGSILIFASCVIHRVVRFSPHVVMNQRLIYNEIVSYYT